MGIIPPTISPLLSMRKPRHRRGHGGVCLNYIRTLRQRFGVDGWANAETLGAKHKACRKNHNRDNPSDKHGKPPSNNSRRTFCCEPPKAAPQSKALPAPRLLETQAHLRYLLGKVHEPANTNKCNNLALAVSANRKNRRFRHS